MLIAHLEIWPFGDVGARETIKTITIANDGTGTPEIGNYTIIFHGATNEKMTIKNWPRTKKDALDLLAEAIKQYRQKPKGKK